MISFERPILPRHASHSAFVEVGSSSSELEPRNGVTLATLVTAAGYVCSIVWILGGSAWFAVAGLLADEIDGRMARAMNETSDYGGELDYAVDVTMTPLVAMRVGIPLPLVVPITLVQARLRADGVRPSVLSARGVLTLYGLFSGAGAPLAR